jgi:predicted O-methyltransferase YrrM
MDFHGMVNGKNEITKGAKTIVAGLKDFISKISVHHYTITHLPTGDGIIIAQKT